MTTPLVGKPHAQLIFRGPDTNIAQWQRFLGDRLSQGHIVRSEIFTYHPQTEARLQWFEMGATSDAIGGAFSYPNTTALPHSAIPCPGAMGH